MAPVKNSLTKKKKKIIIIERFSITCEGQDYAKKEREKGRMNGKQLSKGRKKKVIDRRIDRLKDGTIK